MRRPAPPAHRQFTSNHFLRHHWHPRRRARERRGERAVEVLDGERPPTAQERLYRLLRNVPLGFHLHLMRRGPSVGIVNPSVALAEDEADRVAYELPAPAAEVRARTGAVQGDDDRARLTEVLRTEFGLPGEQAGDHGRILVPPAWTDPLLRRLRW